MVFRYLFFVRMRKRDGSEKRTRSRVTTDETAEETAAICVSKLRASNAIH